MSALLVVIAGSIGAVSRYLIGFLPILSLWPTLIVNASGSFLLGWLIGSGPTGTWVDLAVGFLAGFTTFSTWMVEALMDRAEGRRAGWRLASMLVTGLAAAAVGLAV